MCQSIRLHILKIIQHTHKFIWCLCTFSSLCSIHLRIFLLDKIFLCFVTHKDVGSENLIKFTTSFAHRQKKLVEIVHKHFTKTTNVSLPLAKQQALDVVIINRSPTVDKKNFFFPCFWLVLRCCVAMLVQRKKTGKK